MSRELRKTFDDANAPSTVALTEPQNELLCLCVALAIDCINADAAGAAASSASN
jgi:hypothetical protein